MSNWHKEGKFPPVGETVNYWYEDNDSTVTYKKGLVVYSSNKGATVDIGFLHSSGEQGGFC